MARKVDPAQAAGQAPEHPGADDLDVLFPDQRETVAGETVIVCEYRALAGLRARREARPLLDDLRAVVRFDGDGLVPEQFDVIARHAELWMALIARALKRPQHPRPDLDDEQRSREDLAWLANLPRADFARLEVAYWKANGSFFLDQIVTEAVLPDAYRKLLHSAKSSSTSSAPASDATSTTSPSGSPGARSSVTTD